MKITVIIEDKVKESIFTLSKNKVENYIKNLSEMSHMCMDTIIEDCSTEVGLRYMAKYLLQSRGCSRVKTFEQGTKIEEEFDSRSEALELVYILTSEGYQKSVHYNSNHTIFTLSKWEYKTSKDIETSIEVLDSALMTLNELCESREIKNSKENILPFRTAM